MSTARSLRAYAHGVRSRAPASADAAHAAGTALVLRSTRRRSDMRSGEQRSRSKLRLLRFTILGAIGALLSQVPWMAREGVAAGSDDARAVEVGRRSDPASRAALKLRMDEMRGRRRGHRQQRDEK